VAVNGNPLFAKGVARTRTLRLRFLVFLVVPTLACTLTGNPNILPPTETAGPVSPPTATPVGNTATNNGLFILNLSESDGEGLNKRANEIYQNILDTSGEVSRTVLIDAYAQLAAYQHAGGQWTSIGPAPIQGVYLPQGQIPGSGRVNGFAIDPRDPNVVYAAISIGGIWKTTDAGQTWTSLTDNQVPLIYGGIVMDPKDPDILYAPLGEMDGYLTSQYGYLANGIMRSRDAGATWQLIGQDTFLGAAVSKLVFDKNGKMYASSGQENVTYGPDNMPDFGVFSSDDGGDTWQRLASCSDFGSCVPQLGVEHESLSGGFFDVQVASDGTLFASHCTVGCFSTTLLRNHDGGETWEKLDISDAMAAWQKTNNAQIDYLDDAKQHPRLRGYSIAIAPTNPMLVLTGGGIRYHDSTGTLRATSWLLRSTDGGDTWEWLPTLGEYCSNGVFYQCDYDNVIRIDPTDPQIMYVGGLNQIVQTTYAWVGVLRRSADGGDTWSDLTPAVEGSFMHTDMHALTFDPRDPKIIWAGTDGGVFRTPDASVDPPHWEPLSNGLSTLLMIDIALHPTDANYLLAGMQDNARATTTDRQNWTGTSIGDGAYVAVDPFKPKIVYGSTYAPHLFERNSNGGAGDWTTWTRFGLDGGAYNVGLDSTDNWPFYPPFAVDPNNEGVLYIGSSRIYRTDNRGNLWKPVSNFMNKTQNGQVRSIAIAPSDSNTIFVGTTDGTSWASTDGAQTWSEITGSNFSPRILSQIVADPSDPRTLYAAFGGFNVQTPDTPGHVFASRDGGSSWDDISYNLPDAPLSSVVVDTRDQYAGVYVGGGLGVWVLQTGSQEWLPYGNGMPFTLVTNLKLNPTSGVMAAATYGHSAWVIDMP
jgi:photosystem II stability/assembly factor-like uncharacterized protein